MSTTSRLIEMTSLKLSCCTARWETALVAFSTDKFSQAQFVDQCRRVHEISAIEGKCVVIDLSPTDLSFSLVFVHPFFWCLSCYSLRFADHRQTLRPVLSAMKDAVVTTKRCPQADNEALLNLNAYILNGNIPPETPKSNFVIHFFPRIKIHSHNLRTTNLSYLENGLAIVKLSSCMSNRI